MWRVIPLVLALLIGFWFGQPERHNETVHPFKEVHPEKEFPVSEHKSFVIVVYAHNEALWCERALRSIFEQDYDHYRVIVIDDASIDQTHERAKEFILKNNQDEKVILIRNQERLGPVACLYRAIDSCLDREIVLPLDAKDWLSSPIALNRLNIAYQNPDVWLSIGKTIHYPSYEINRDERASFYAGLFKELKLEDLYQNGKFSNSIEAYQNPIIDLSGGRIKLLEDPITFSNEAVFKKGYECKNRIKKYQPLREFPKKNVVRGADILVFSFDRPLQLYACLESIQRYLTGFQTLSVLYRASNEGFNDGYKKVMDAFPKVRFVAQSMKDPKHDFKPKLNKLVFDSPSEYILFAVDDIIVKDFCDLRYCMEQMEKTGAYGFYLRMGRHITYCYQFDRAQSLPKSHPLSNELYAWDFRSGEYDWGFANSLDMTLFRKEEIRKPFEELKYKTPNSLEYNWTANFKPPRSLGLYFEVSKIVNIPMNIVGRTGNPHMNYLNPDELLAKFNQGLKVDIEPLYKIENQSPHLDYIPDFIMR